MNLRLSCSLFLIYMCIAKLETKDYDLPMNKVKITVVKITQYEDLIKKYENPIKDACFMSLGDTLISECGEMPPSFCKSAWDTVKEFVAALANGGGNFYGNWMKDPKSAMISCNDGFRPVSFYIEVIK